MSACVSLAFESDTEMRKRWPNTNLINIKTRSLQYVTFWSQEVRPQAVRKPDRNYKRGGVAVSQNPRDGFRRRRSRTASGATCATGGGDPESAERHRNTSLGQLPIISTTSIPYTAVQLFAALCKRGLLCSVAILRNVRIDLHTKTENIHFTSAVDFVNIGDLLFFV